MLLARMLSTRPLLAFVALCAMGIMSLILGAAAFRLGKRNGTAGDDSLIMDGVVGPVLAMFALMVAFTFGQALTLESGTFSGLVSVRIASQELHASLASLAEPGRSRSTAAADAYLVRLQQAVTANNLDSASRELMNMEVEFRTLMNSLDEGGSRDLALERLGKLADSVRDLQINSAQRIPVTVLSVQSLYYVVCFLMLGYKAAEHGVHGEARLFLYGLAVLFAVVMFMAMNVGRPGLNPMFFDPLPKVSNIVSGTQPS